MQISASLSASMHYQVQREYNKTAKLPNATSADTIRITEAWDSLQSKVSLVGVDIIIIVVRSNHRHHRRRHHHPLEETAIAVL